MSPSPLKRFIFALLLCSAPLHAAEHPRYAVISLVGDQLTIVTRVATTGSRIDQNPKQQIPAEGLALDDAILDEAGQLLPRLAPEAHTSLLGIRDPEAFQKETDVLQLPEVRKALDNAKPDRIILVHKYRSEAHLAFRGQSLGNGYLQGLGFYIHDDRDLIFKDLETGETAEGFLAVFAYLQISLLDGHDFREIRSLPITASEVFLPANKSVKAWEALSSADKLSTLRKLTLHSVRTHLPKLLAE